MRSASSGSGIPIAEDNRDLPGLISTLTEDCVYELVQTGHRWEGHEGAARFYGGLLGAFPDIDFQLTDIVIGPQGVCEEADVTGTHEAEWLGDPAHRRTPRLEGRRSSSPGTASSASSAASASTPPACLCLPADGRRRRWPGTSRLPARWLRRSMR